MSKQVAAILIDDAAHGALVVMLHRRVQVVDVFLQVRFTRGTVLAVAALKTCLEFGEVLVQRSEMSVESVAMTTLVMKEIAALITAHLWLKSLRFVMLVALDTES